MTVIPFKQPRHSKGAPAGIGGRFDTVLRDEVDVDLSTPFGAPSEPTVREQIVQENIAAMHDAVLIAKEYPGRACEPDLTDEWLACAVQGVDLTDPQRWDEAVAQAEASRRTPRGGVVSPGLHYALDYRDSTFESVPSVDPDTGATTYTRRDGRTTHTFTTPTSKEVDEGGRPWSDGSGYYRYVIGDRATKGKYRRAAEIAKDIRADLKAAAAVGWLPNNLDYRVTCDSFSGGQAIRIEVQGWSDDDRRAPQHVLDRSGDWMRGNERAAVREVKGRVEAIRTRYAANCSMGEIDFWHMDYYGETKIEDDSWKAFRERERARKAARQS